MKILYVEDDKLLRETTSNCFEMLKEEFPQLETIISETAEDAIALLRERVFDIVITDFDLGSDKYNGTDVSNLAAQRGTQRVVLNSGNVDMIPRDGLFDSVEVKRKMQISEIMDLVSMTVAKFVLNS